MKKTLISLLTAGLFGVMSQGAFAAPELMDKVLAVVNKDVVLASQQEALVQKVKASAQESGQSLPDDVTLRKQALDRLIQESLQLQLADRQGLKISDTQLEQAIQSIAADNKPNDTEPENIEAWAKFHEVVEALPEPEREVVNLLWYEEMSQPEAAEVLGISLATVKRRWQSARIRLSESLDGEAFQ